MPVTLTYHRRMDWDLSAAALAARVIILANGPLTADGLTLLQARLRPCDVLIAADGGANHACALGRPITALIGDMDSVSATTLQWLQTLSQPCQRLIYAPDKNYTDLELALSYAQRRYPRAQICIAAATAGRLDMGLANTLLLARHSYGVQGTASAPSTGLQLWDAWDTAFALCPPGGQFRIGQSGDRITLLSLSPLSQGIVTRGLQWALTQESLALGEGRGVSNSLQGAEFSLQLQTGTLLVVHSPTHHE